MTTHDAPPDPGRDAEPPASDDPRETGAPAPATALAEPLAAATGTPAEPLPGVSAPAMMASAAREPDALDILLAPDDVAAEVPVAAPPAPQWADESSHATALTWVDPAAVAGATGAVAEDERVRAGNGASLLRDARLRRGFLQTGVLAPLCVLGGLIAVYAGTTLLWPLHAVAPTIDAVTVQAAAAPAADLPWPTEGSAALGVGGLGVLASTPDADGIASVTKVVTTLMVLDRLPLAVGEQGPEYEFSYSDSREYWRYREQNQSSLDVPVDGTLTEYQMLQGTLLGSANNYIDRLAREIWGSNREFAEAAETWLAERGLGGITVVTPSGFDEGNRATPEALVKLAELAMKNPVFAEIVGTRTVTLPGAGAVKNTNGMLEDEGVVGIKTGTLEHWNILTAKDVTLGESTVHLYAAVLGQDSDEDRLAATRALFADAERALQTQEPAVPAGTVVGEIQTVWGASADIVTDADAEVVLWNSAVATTATAFDLGDDRTKGARVGTLTTTGPLNSAETSISLAEELAGPSAWWRLTHPMELFGIAGTQD